MFSSVTTLSSGVASLNTSSHSSINIKDQYSGRLGGHQTKAAHIEQRPSFSNVPASCAPGKGLCMRLVSVAAFFQQMNSVFSTTVSPALAVSEPLSRCEPAADNNGSVWSEPGFYIPFGLAVIAGTTMLGICAYDYASKRFGGGGEHQAQTSRGEGSVIYRSSSRVSLPDPDLQLASVSSASSVVAALAEGASPQPVAKIEVYSLFASDVDACEPPQEVIHKRKMDKQPLLLS